MASLHQAKKGKEIERRWLVTDIDKFVWLSPRHEIQQGYFETLRPESNFRVRLIDNKHGVLTKKDGTGVERDEEEEKLPLAAARLLYRGCPYKLEKTRFLRDGWEIDRMEGPLKGIILAELEMASRDQHVVLPSWIREATEVTDSLTNFHLAKLATDLTEDPHSTASPLATLVRPRLPRIVLTGGPCSGKSSIMASLRNTFSAELHCVPEVATIVIGQVGIIPPMDQPTDLRRFQRVLARVQNDFETISADQAQRDGKKALLLDRGRIDNAAYLPGGLDEFESICQTTRAYEYSQYDAVIHLAMPGQIVYEERHADNAARRESYDEARALGERIKQVWSGHPRCISIGSYANWQSKAEAVIEVVAEILRG